MRSVLVLFAGAILAFGQQSPLVVSAGSRVVLVEYEAWFGPGAVGFEGNPAQPLLQSASMSAIGRPGYDSADPAVIAQHAKWITGLGADGILVDLTNNVACIFSSAWAQFCKPSDHASNGVIASNTLNLFQAYNSLGTGLKIVPMVGGADPTSYSVDPANGKTSLEEEIDAFVGQLNEYPGLAVSYYGHPLIAIYVGCPDPVGPGSPYRLAQGIAAKYPQITFRLVGGFLDSQPSLWWNQFDAAHQVSFVNPMWSWVDRLNPSAHLEPTYNLFGSGVENLTASVATPGQAGWFLNGSYDPVDALAQGGATFAAFIQVAETLKPTFLLVHQFNEFGENGGDAQTDDDIEPSTLTGMSMLTAVGQQIAAYKMALSSAAASVPPAPSVSVTPAAQSLILNGQTVSFSSGTWTIGSSTVSFGLSGDLPLIINWQGAQHLGVWRPSTRQLFVDSDNTSYHVDNAVVL